jgi:hypothetical protein
VISVSTTYSGAPADKLAALAFEPLPGTVVRMKGVDVIGAFEKAVEMLQDAKAKFRPTFVLTMTPGACFALSLFDPEWWFLASVFREYCLTRRVCGV